MAKFLVGQVALAVYCVFIVLISTLTISSGVNASKIGPSYASDPVSLEGRKLFQTKGCAVCHLLDRQGNAPNGPDLALTKVGQRRDVHSIVQLVKDPQSQYPGTIMPAQSGMNNLSDEELTKIAEYLAKLK
ncbi:MAG: cytochrome c [Chloroflexota bacterium]|nr:MAG: cytochrome c [Chloroflexota bacterium]